MLIKMKRGWEIPESAATDEAAFRNRRTLMKALAAGPIALAGAGLPGLAQAAAGEADPTADLYPVKRNEAYTLDRPLTDEDEATSYNNFYEFGSHKQIKKAAQKMNLRPWEIVIDGMVEKEIRVGVDDLIRQMPLEERLYRHRCVEAWAMAVPWSGFPMAELVKFAKPTFGARFVRMQTLQDAETMPGLRQPWYPWPYTEGLTIDEATNELAFMATGLYGKPMPKQNGATIRLVVPWKYGFKSIKSIVRFTFTDEQPVGLWEEVQPKEYGFYANVNPEVAHPRWSQATERMLGTGERVPTLLYNGYAEQVAELYKDVDPAILFK